jgi:hypothetical protein
MTALNDTTVVVTLLLLAYLMMLSIPNTIYIASNDWVITEYRIEKGMAGRAHGKI